MEDFFRNIPFEQAEQMNELARLTFELRENRKQLLARHGAEDEGALKETILSGALPEHPTYEDYLGAKILGEAREAIRQDLKDFLKTL